MTESFHALRAAEGGDESLDGEALSARLEHFEPGDEYGLFAFTADQALPEFQPVGELHPNLADSIDTGDDTGNGVHPAPVDNFEKADSDWRISGPAFALSLLVHVLALAAAITLRPEPLRESALTDLTRILEIGLRPAPAPIPVIESMPPTPAEAVEEAAPAPIENTIEESLAETGAEPEVAPAETAVEPAEASSSPAKESVRDNTAVSIPRMPDVLSVRDSVRAVGEAQRQQVWQSDCNPLEEEAGIRDCGPARSSGFERLDYNATYQSLNGQRILSRSEQALPTIKANRQQMLDALRSADIGADTRSIVTQELEAAITEATSTGNRAVQHMERLTDRSAAAEMAREILGDPWVVEGYRLLEQRKARLGSSTPRSQQQGP